jgi:hypothetical protein
MTRLRIAAADPKSAGELVRRRLAEFLSTAYLADDQQSQALAAAGEYFAARQDHRAAIELAERQLRVVSDYERGRLMLRTASLLRAAGDVENSTRYVRNAVDVLREQLRPKPPRSGPGGAMTVDLFDALSSLPTASLGEKRAAADQVLAHEVVPQAEKERVRRALAAFENR